MRESGQHNFRIEIDGGVGSSNIAELVRAGAEILVAGTSVFGAADPAAAVRSIIHLASESLAQKV
jgi:ribulose-phosphate 3-epimerase